MKKGAVLSKKDAKRARNELLKLDEECRRMLYVASGSLMCLKDRSLAERATDIIGLLNKAEAMSILAPKYGERLMALTSRRKLMRKGPIDAATLDNMFKIGVDYDKWLRDFTEEVIPVASALQQLIPQPEKQA